MSIFKKFVTLSKKEAQTAIELAIFGAILIFVLSIIVRQAYSANFSQNQQLKAMRMAMSRSYRSSEAGNPAHNTATFLIIEDRLTPSTGKYGPITRTPFIMSGSGSMSNQLFQPVTYGNNFELPRFDLVVNGQRFQFTVSGFKELVQVNEQRPPGFTNPAIWPTGHPDYDPQCAFRLLWGGTSYNIVDWLPCRRVYQQIPNFVVGGNKEKNKYCCQDAPVCQGAPPLPPPGCAQVDERCCLDSNLPTNERFDLDRDLLTTADRVTLIGQRVIFAWQWYLVKAFDPKRSGPPPGGGQTPQEVIPYGLNYGEFLRWEPRQDGEKINTVVDVDLDLKEEFVLGATYSQLGAITTLQVQDFQEGDIDFANEGSATKPKQGLQDDLRMYTFTQDGTFLQVDEGKLYTALPDNRQFVRNVQKRDRIDIIERVFQLNKDSGRFCAGGVPVPIVDPGTPLAHTNPIEACNNCFAPSKVQLTCFDQTTFLIFIRSRLRDRSGRKWVTPVE